MSTLGNALEKWSENAEAEVINKTVNNSQWSAGAKRIIECNAVILLMLCLLFFN